MPRRSRYDLTDEELEHRAWTRYLSECHCHPLEDPSELCAFCQWHTEEVTEMDQSLTLSPFYTEIQTLKSWIQRVQEGTTEAERIDAVRSLFTTLLGYETFLATYPKFRSAAMEKANEFRGHKTAGPMLKELLDHFDELIHRLPDVEGYKAE